MREGGRKIGEKKRRRMAPFLHLLFSKAESV
jgi:hypothetical protein